MANTPELPMNDPNRLFDTENKEPEDETKAQEIVNVLTSYKQEAEHGRKNGPHGRDEKWKENLDLYWNRYDYSKKADWQSKQAMPVVTSFVDRFAAALKEAMVAVPEGFYTVIDPADVDNDLTQAIKRMTDVWLSRCGRNQNGHILGFPAVFEEQCKLGAIAAMSSVVTWKSDTKHGRVAVETVDPRFTWLDPTYRNLYRIRQTEIDLHELTALADMKDNKGNSLYNLGELNRLVGQIRQEAQAEKENMAGHSQEVKAPTRKPVVLDEYLATVVDPSGEVLAEHALIVVANDRFLIRGPEKNPFWHGMDWYLYAPLVTVPLSVYGRSYMEDFGNIAKTFNELTNLILDATFTSSMNAFAMAPGLLLNPEQARSGIHPNKNFLLEDGVRPQDFFHSIELGQLPPDSIRVWSALKDQLTEDAGQNEIGLGQFAPKSRTSATEIIETQSNSSALVRSIAQTVETRWLDPTLDLVWKTGVQHMSKNDEMLRDAAGDRMFEALFSRRRELVKRPITFQARGISTLIKKARTLQALLKVLQIIGSNELMLREFLRVADMTRLVELLFELSDVDLRKLQTSERDRLIREVANPLEEARQRAEQNTEGQSAPERVTSEATDVANRLGIASPGG